MVSVSDLPPQGLDSWHWNFYNWRFTNPLMQLVAKLIFEQCSDVSLLLLVAIRKEINVGFLSIHFEFKRINISL